jgi:hypothetical protein
MAPRKNVKTKKRSAALRKGIPLKVSITKPEKPAPVKLKVELPLIPHHDNELTQAIATSIDLATEFAARLAPVLVPTENEMLVGHTASTGVSLADSLISKTDAVTALNTRLNDLLERLAL